MEAAEVERAEPHSLRAPAVAGSFEEVYEREYRALASLAFSLTGNWAVAEELVQEALFRLHKRWSRVRDDDRPGAWLRRVLLNLATSRARRLAAEARALARLGRERRPEAGLSDEAAQFWAVVRGLPRRQAQVLALYYAEDRPVADIARILDCAEGTVRAHLHQGRAAVAARFGIDDEDGGRDERGA